MLSQAFGVVVLSIRAFLAVILIVAGVAKLTDQEDFMLTLSTLGVAARQKWLSRCIALFIPLIELCVGLLVVSNLWLIVADTAVLLLMLIFSGAVIFALRKAPNSECRCFGALSKARFSHRLFLRSIMLTLMALVVLFSRLMWLHVEVVPLWLTVLLIAEYGMLAIVTMHAVRVIDKIKERMAV
jgi:uncharacterized membrane protein YphA (DoxX/SURF4 family)